LTPRLAQSQIYTPSYSDKDMDNLFYGTLLLRKNKYFILSDLNVDRSADNTWPTVTGSTVLMMEMPEENFFCSLCVKNYQY